ncbi:MAG: class I SAM-dependent methyltransferase [Deltaproteobacteria bacterium]|nr:class I SAM-dependent methyltransferase [Deltaproteobacteria bacterium]
MALWNPRDYDSWYLTPLGRVSDAIEKSHILALAGVMPGEKAFDAGCGTGIYTIELAKRGAYTAGFDNSLDMLLSAKAKAEKEGLTINFLAADATGLPFKDGSFDIALSVGMLCFIADMDGALLEMKRVLRPGGRIVIGVLNKWSPWALLRRIKGLFKETVYDRARNVSPPQLKRALITAGFDAVEIRTCLFFLPVNSSLYLKLAKFCEIPAGFLSPYTGAFIAASAKKPM